MSRTVKENKGSELLIPKSEWVPESEIQGDESKTLRSPMVEKAFQRILELWNPKHKVALVSLCTATRPYSESRKWKTFKEHFGDKADMIICSNGGIIPIEFESCYPYLTYDAHGQAKWDNLYVNVCYRRLNEFFKKHKYDKIVFNFRPGMRNRLAAKAFVRDWKGDEKIYILPDEKLYKELQDDGFPSGKMFPDCDDRVIEVLRKAIEE